MQEKITPRDILRGMIPEEGASQNMLTPSQMADEIKIGLGIDSKAFGVMVAAKFMESGKFEDPSRYICDAYDSLILIQRTYGKEKLPIFIRRKSRMFNGESALYWMMNGRIEDVAVDIGFPDVHTMADRDQSEIEQRYPLNSNS